MIEEINQQEMWVLCAPDGSAQLPTLAPSPAACIGIVKMLHKAKMGRSCHELCVLSGFSILPVKLSLFRNGDGNEVFKNKPHAQA